MSEPPTPSHTHTPTNTYIHIHKKQVGLRWITAQTNVCCALCVCGCVCVPAVTSSCLDWEKWVKKEVRIIRQTGGWMELLISAEVGGQWKGRGLTPLEIALEEGPHPPPSPDERGGAPM